MIAAHTIAALLCLGTATAVLTEAQQQAWENFKIRFNKTYDEEEHALRMQAFKENLLIIDELNEAEDEATFAVNKFSDLRPEEFALRYMGYRRIAEPSNTTAFADEAGIEAVDFAKMKSFDWRDQTPSPVTAVKDQGQCGSCWAFSATEGIESAWIMAGNEKKILAPQEIVSCDKQDLGCNGGDLPTALDWVKSISKKDNGLTLEKTYPYTSGNSGKNGKCKRFKETGGSCPVSTYSFAIKQCTKGNCRKQASLESTMAAVLMKKGPLSICLNAGPWQNYNSGIIKTAFKCGGAAAKMDHCVQAVGFNTDGMTPYWIVRNSWNTDWGIDGYIHLAMNKNVCGVANEAVFVNGE